MPPPRIFEKLSLLDHRTAPGAPGWNMAADEALLENSRMPLLRVYRWCLPAVSFGYFLPVAEAETVAGGREMVRRWTGGGIVEHGADFTWSLIVPASHYASRSRPIESYGHIHATLAEALGAAGIQTAQQGSEAPAPAGGMCMNSPAPGDVLHRGRKIAGAGQRRCRYGLLHQGSVGGVELPEHFPSLLAGALAEEVQPFAWTPALEQRTAALVAERYGTEAWLRKR